MRKHKRRQNIGSMLVLAVSIITVLFIPMFMMLCQFGPYAVYSGRAQNAVEAAAKIAAIDLSRIVINDPDFGYVSLSNHPPVGKATCALDGEPLPVTGINTLVGTLRQDAIVADELHNETMKALVDKDLDSLTATIKDLNATLADALSDYTRKGRCSDMDGKAVNSVEDVKLFLRANLPPQMQVETVKLSLGWLTAGSETIIPAPQPLTLAQVQARDIQDGKYLAFIKYPVGRRSFSFAGLGSQVHLVPSHEFWEDDGKHICSIVKIECTLVSTDESHAKTQFVACAQACSQPDATTPGAMTVRFPGRPVLGLLSWSDFLNDDNFRDHKITTFAIVDGDYPFEKKARMQQSQTEEQLGTTHEFAEHYYYWLRNGHLRPRLDAILSMTNDPFYSAINRVYTYEISQDGSISRKVMDGNRFTRSVTADGQFAAMADTRVKSGASAVIFFRDSVRRLSTESGKHAGQPLAGYPLRNLDEWVDQDQLALNFCKRNSYPDGLAVDIEIGGTGDSTAAHDAVSMRQRTQSRKI